MSKQHEQVADLLDDAADVIERDGWFQAHPYRQIGGGGYCALTAIEHVAGGFSNPLWLDAVKALSFAADLSWDLECPVATWNNAPERTMQQVLDTFRLAAKQERCADAELPREAVTS